MVEAEITALFPVKTNETVTKERSTQTFRAIVSKDETVTLEIGTLVSTLVFKLSDGTTITHTKTAGYITITEDPCVNVPVVGYAVGAVPS